MRKVIIFDKYALWLLSQHSYHQQLDMKSILILIVDGKKETDAEKNYWSELLRKIHTASHVWSLEDLDRPLHQNNLIAADKIYLYSNTDHLVKKLKEITPQTKLVFPKSLPSRGRFSKTDLNNLNKKLDALKTVENPRVIFSLDVDDMLFFNFDECNFVLNKIVFFNPHAIDQLKECVLVCKNNKFEISIELTTARTKKFNEHENNKACPWLHAENLIKKFLEVAGIDSAHYSETVSYLRNNPAEPVREGCKYQHLLGRYPHQPNLLVVHFDDQKIYWRRNSEEENSPHTAFVFVNQQEGTMRVPLTEKSKKQVTFYPVSSDYGTIQSSEPIDNNDPLDLPQKDAIIENNRAYIVRDLDPVSAANLNEKDPGCFSAFKEHAVRFFNFVRARVEKTPTNQEPTSEPCLRQE